MTFVITNLCQLERACIAVCPVDCIYVAPGRMVIHPDECIECEACLTECPMSAIVLDEKASAKDLVYNLSESAKLKR